MICQGPHCGPEIRFAKIEDVGHPVNWPAEVVTLADGRRAIASVLHTSICPDGRLNLSKRQKPATGKGAHP